MFARFLAAIFATFAWCAAWDPASAEPEKPVVERLDENRFRIGSVTFDQKTREIRFPASINMNDGLLEFIIVHENGKIHESLLKTDISPTHLNLAFTLLRYPPSPELYRRPDAGPPAVSETTQTGARISIRVEWKDGEKTRDIPINEWVQHTVNGTTMPEGPWVYGGSEIQGGKFVPETTGDIAAIYLSNTSLINYPGKDNGDDTVWFAYPKRVPAPDTPVTVIIAPFKNDQPLSKP
jgi:hypothetical protein